MGYLRAQSAGVSLDDRLIEDFGAEGGFPLSDVADALGLVGVEAIALALYSDLPSEAIESIDKRFPGAVRFGCAVRQPLLLPRGHPIAGHACGDLDCRAWRRSR